jgi:hypothetical protein
MSTAGDSPKTDINSFDHQVEGLRFSDGHVQKLVFLPNNFVLSRADSSSVDVLFTRLSSATKANLDLLQNHGRRADPEANYEFARTLWNIAVPLELALEDKRLNENPLVFARSDSLKLVSLLRDLKKLESMLEPPGSSRGRS